MSWYILVDVNDWLSMCVNVLLMWLMCFVIFDNLDMNPGQMGSSTRNGFWLLDLFSRVAVSANDYILFLIDPIWRSTGKPLVPSPAEIYCRITSPRGANTSSTKLAGLRVKRWLHDGGWDHVACFVASWALGSKGNMPHNVGDRIKQETNVTKKNGRSRLERNGLH